MEEATVVTEDDSNSKDSGISTDSETNNADASLPHFGNFACTSFTVFEDPFIDLKARSTSEPNTGKIRNETLKDKLTGQGIRLDNICNRNRLELDRKYAHSQMLGTPKSRFGTLLCTPVSSKTQSLFSACIGPPFHHRKYDGIGGVTHGTSTMDLSGLGESDRRSARSLILDNSFMEISDCSSVYDDCASLTDTSSVFNEIGSAGFTNSRIFWRVDSEKSRKSLRRTLSEGIPSPSDKCPMKDGCYRSGSLGEYNPTLSAPGGSRKRTHVEPLWSDDALKKQKQPEAKSGSRKSQKFHRAQSSSILERGEFAKVPDDELPKVLEVEYSLETVRKPQVDSAAFKSVSAETLCSLMLSLGEKEFSQRYLLVDCRYPYEFDGGHIKGAINLHDPATVGEVFYPSDEESLKKIMCKIPIFYCEFSQKRGPTMAYALRALDRKRNELRYPEVDYKEMYIIDHGYRQFFKLGRSKGLCVPNSYTTMVDGDHIEELRSFRFHRSRSFCSVDCTIAKERCRIPSRSRRNKLSCRVGQFSKSILALDTIAASPPQQESPTQFANEAKVDTYMDVESDQNLPLTPLSKLEFS